jgi:hypothetical protein
MSGFKLLQKVTDNLVNFYSHYRLYLIEATPKI